MNTESLEERRQQLLEEGQRIAESYSDYIEPLRESYLEKNGEDAPAHIVATTAFALRNLDEQIASMDETTKSTNLGTFADHGYKMITAVLPNLVIDKVVSMQPLKIRTGDIFFMNFKAQKRKGSVQAGDSLLSSTTGPSNDSHYTSEEIDSEELAVGDGTATEFSGNLDYAPVYAGTVEITDELETFTDDGEGNLTGSEGGSGTINYESGAYEVTFDTAPTADQPIFAEYEWDSESNPGQTPEVFIDLDQKPVTARPYRLRYNYTLDAAFDLKQAHGKDADEELLAATSSLVRSNIDQIVLEDIRRKANGGTVSFDATVPTGISKSDHYEGFTHTLTKANNMIYSGTQMVSGSFIVAGTNAASVIEGMRSFNRTQDKVGRQPAGPHIVGEISGMTVIKNASYPANEFVVGYKGPGNLFAGYIWAPYRALYVSPKIVLDDFKGRRAMYTSAGRKMVNDLFYVNGTIQNYS